MLRRQFCTMMIAGGALAGLNPIAAAQSGYPDRPVKIVVPYVPGGVTDTMARLLAQKLTERLKQSVIVENRPGAGGVIGTENVIRAAPDGLSLLFATATLTVYPSFEKNFTYDIEKDLKPVTIVSSAPYVILVGKDSPFRSLKDLIDYAKANPDKLNFGSPGYGTSTHLAFEAFLAAAGVKAVHIPYKGSAAVLPALTSNEVQAMMDTYIGVAGAVEAGHVRALAITADERASFAPAIPTTAEAGLPGFTVDTWFAVLAPGKTPDAIVEKLNHEIGAVLKDPQVAASFSNQGKVIGNSPAEFARTIGQDRAKWARTIAAAGIKPQ
jgi:tripartite-type tricarboxylate transporter receptor subunit TctC